MDYLIFQLQAPLSSWGETAVGEYRPTANYPSRSAIFGLLAAALGIDRVSEDGHHLLISDYSMAIGVQSLGSLLRDYHTSQVATESVLSNQPHNIRRDELIVPPEKRKDHLKTILSTRDYRQDATSLVAICSRKETMYSLDAIADALRKPKYVLYFGRKSCPPSLPLWPQVIEAPNALDAMNQYLKQLAMLSESLTILPLEQLIWEDGVTAGCDVDIQVLRKDRLLSRKNWQFGDRHEYIKFLRRSE